MIAPIARAIGVSAQSTGGSGGSTVTLTNRASRPSAIAFRPDGRDALPDALTGYQAIWRHMGSEPHESPLTGLRCGIGAGETKSCNRR